MIEINITPKIINKAKKRFELIKPIDKSRELHRFRSEENRLKYGLIGEEVVLDHLGINGEDTYNYDLIHEGYKIDVKTVSCKFKPLPHYLCTVNSSELDVFRKQKTDYYFFVRIKYDCSVAWIIGYMKSSLFFTKAKLVKKGETIDGMPFVKADAYVLPINELNKFK
jgi:hypothetical protein